MKPSRLRFVRVFCAAAALALAVGLGATAKVPAAASPPAAKSPGNVTDAGWLGTHSHASTTWWVPPLGVQPWQWELSNPLRTTDAKQMGTNDKLPDGSPAPAPVIYDIDAINNPASTVSALHALRKHVVCYIEVGAAGNYYSATEEGIGTSYYDQLAKAGVLGAPVSGWPERYVDIRSTSTVAIVEAMVKEQCATKGFDAVETDIDEEYHSANGFGLTLADQERYMGTLADYIHGLGLGWWIKNPDDTGDRYASDMQPLADAVLTEQCNQYSSCAALNGYLGHKAVFNAEYHRRPSQFCGADAALGINGTQFNLNLTGVRRPCR